MTLWAVKKNLMILHLIKIENFLRLIEDNAKYVVNKIKYDNYYDFKVDDCLRNTLIYNLSKNE
jgi:hypothetical protein